MLLAASCTVQRYEVGRDDVQGPPTAESIARMRTNRLDKLVGLSDSQYSKLYRFHRNQAQQQMDNAPMGRPGMGPGGPGMRPGMGPGMGPQGGPGMGRPNGEGRPDMGQRPQGPPQGERRGPIMSQDQMDEMMEAMAKMAEKTERKYRNVLTPEQYELWTRAENERMMRGMQGGPRR
jgi:hypothetical protein